MKLLVVGSGGREHALAWKLATDNKVEHIWVAPGNAGTSLENKISNIDIKATNIEALAKFATDNNIDYTIVGPEAAIAAGIADYFNAHGLKIFSPSALASQLESSKSFAKDFMVRNQIPTAKYQSFTTKNEAINYLDNFSAPWVIKDDGLAAGKGVVIAQTKLEAVTAIEQMLADNNDKSNKKIVIEQFLTGEEASFIVMVDDNGNILPLATSQDHKARDNGDLGPNTGGMGAYSPAPIINEQLHNRIINDIVQPTVNGLQQQGISYQGFLYVGLMIDKQGNPLVLEYNCRFGDPETQPILARLESSLLDLIEHGIYGTLNQAVAKWSNNAAVGVCMVSEGYPNSYEVNKKISGLHKVTTAKVFHAGTKLTAADGTLITAGGRVLCVTALAADIKQAKAIAYQEVSKITWNGMYFRTDIADKAII